MIVKSPAPKKSLGQHFLTDKRICVRIANLLHPESTDNLLEIGPGPGALTTALEDSPHAMLLLLEKDWYWSGERKRLRKPGTVIINCDALKFPWHRLEFSGKWKICGNLPYNVASPLIWQILSQCVTLERSVFMVQKEVGMRLAARPSTREYGALSVWAQSFSKPKVEFLLAPGAFQPPPKVISAVVSFTPLLPRPAFPEKLKRLLDLCFQKRRKQLGVIFRQAGLPEMETALETMHISATLRPENLAPEQFQALAACLS